MRKWYAAFFAVLLALGACYKAAFIPAQADIGLVTYTVTITGVGTSPAFALQGQSNCNIQTSGTFSVLSATPQISPDNQVTWATASGLSVTPIIAVGTSGGPVSTAAIPAPTAIRINVTSFTGSSVTFYIACSGTGVTGASGGGGGPVTQNTSPWIVGVSATPFPVSGSFSPVTQPIPTNSPGLAPTVGSASLSYAACFVPAGATPNATGGNMIAQTAQSNGSCNVNVTNATTPITLPTTSPPPNAPPVISYVMPHQSVNCTGTVGSHNLACASTAGVVTCANNAATDTCTFTGASIFDYIGMKSVSSTAQTATLGCYNSASSTPPSASVLDINLLGITQAVSPIFGQPMLATNITCVLTGSGAINAGGITVIVN